MPRKKTQEDVEFDARVGKRIEAARKKKGLGGVHFAARVGITQQALYWYEAGRSSCPFRVLMKMATELGMRVSDFTT